MGLEPDGHSLQVDIDSNVLTPSHAVIGRDPQALISPVLQLCNVIASSFADRINMGCQFFFMVCFNLFIY